MSTPTAPIAPTAVTQHPGAARQSHTRRLARGGDATERPPMGHVADRRQQRRVDHRRAQPQQHRASSPRRKPAVATIRKMPSACSPMPPAISRLRPT